MKKLFSIIFILSFAFNSFGSYLWFGILQQKVKSDIKREIRSGLKDEDLTKFIFSSEEKGPAWIKINKEFRFDDEMYDVVRIKKEGSKKCYFCIRDDKEKKLIVNFKKNHKSKNNNANLKKRPIHQYLPVKLFTLNGNIDHLKLFHHYCGEDFKSNIMDVPYPPPRT